jgi:hypothetical protein
MKGYQILLLVLLILAWSYCVKQKSKFAIPGLVLIFAIYFIFLSADTYKSTPEERNYLRKINEDCLNAIGEPHLRNISVKPNSSSYTNNKSEINICLKRKTGGFFSKNDLVFVTLHEYAHVITKQTEYGENGKVNDHGPVWLRNFQRLLDIAEKDGIYNKSIPLDPDYISDCNVEN